ncbi:MAG: hypothetical protein VYA34_14660 [Myxococcota bacterium]|nr:hypothetical protein [Myxococcota bacterium]
MPPSLLCAHATSEKCIEPIDAEAQCAAEALNIPNITCLNGDFFALDWQACSFIVQPEA